MKSLLILMRHGESIWNKKNRFTGWVDVPLSENGINEAYKGGDAIKDISIDIAFTSSLIRAQMTLFLTLLKSKSSKTPIMMHEKGKMKKWAIVDCDDTEILPVFPSWHLNERMYGKLQGLNKQKTREKYGEEQVHIWRRSYDAAPPNGESLKMTAKRTLPFFNKKILPYIKKNNNILIVAHGNSLRSIVMELEQLNDKQIVKVEIPTGVPLIYSFECNKWIKKNN